MREVVNRREQQSYSHLAQQLGKNPFGARAIDDMPNLVAYVKHIEARPAYQKAMQIAGPKAKNPG